MRIIIKIGSNLLTREGGHLDITRLSDLVDQAAALKAAGHEIVIVSSGAVACGRGELDLPDPQLDSVEQRQLYSALGQVKLINHYYALFHEYGMHVGQVLTTRVHFATTEERKNQQACMELMLHNGVIPVVNENDTVCLTGLLFTDNDELSGLIARMLRADRLIILSNIDGVYDRDPSDPGATLLRHLKADADLTQYIGSGKSAEGRGGMASKLATATSVAAEGIPVIIANGRRRNVLLNLVKAPWKVEHTEVSR